MSAPHLSSFVRLPFARLSGFLGFGEITDFGLGGAAILAVSSIYSFASRGAASPR